MCDAEVCAYGERHNYALEQCEACPVGFYQMNDLVDVCLACPDGYSTQGTGQIGSQQDACQRESVAARCGAGRAGRKRLSLMTARGYDTLLNRWHHKLLMSSYVV